jgi:NADH:ubiquinone oxidoreductase subunit 2 (subunit N)
MALLRWLHKDKPPVLLKVRSSAGLIVTTCSFAIFTVSGLLLFNFRAVHLTSPQDIFLYGVIVPILPFSLEDRIGVDTDKVQYWVSIALAVFGAALLAGSRKLTSSFQVRNL